MGIAAEPAGAVASSVGVQISVGISNQGQFRNSPGCRISWTGPNHIIIGRAETTSHRRGISSLLTGTQMEPEIMLDWLNVVMGGLFTPLKAIEAMQLDEDRIELGVGQYMGIVCQSIEKLAVLGRCFQVMFK